MMYHDPTKENSTNAQATRRVNGQKVTTQQLADFENFTLQEEYRRAYLLQLKRQSCPGCGDEGSLF